MKPVFPRFFFHLFFRALLGAGLLTGLAAFFFSTPLFAAPSPSSSPSVDAILVKKGARKMYLLHKKKIVRTYTVALGGNPVGHKRQQGDRRTPEGKYVIDGRNPDSKFHLSLRISYPNRQEAARARAQGIDPGGWIMIHGLPNGTPELLAPLYKKTDWTDGCIAVDNGEIEEIWRLVKDGTPIEIRP